MLWPYRMIACDEVVANGHQIIQRQHPCELTPHPGGRRGQQCSALSQWNEFLRLVPDNAAAPRGVQRRDDRDMQRPAFECGRQGCAIEERRRLVGEERGIRKHGAESVDPRHQRSGASRNGAHTVKRARKVRGTQPTGPDAERLCLRYAKAAGAKCFGEWSVHGARLRRDRARRGCSAEAVDPVDAAARCAQHSRRRRSRLRAAPRRTRRTGAARPAMPTDSSRSRCGARRALLLRGRAHNARRGAPNSKKWRGVARGGRSSYEFEGRREPMLRVGRRGCGDGLGAERRRAAGYAPSGACSGQSRSSRITWAAAFVAAFTTIGASRFTVVPDSAGFATT